MSVIKRTAEKENKGLAAINIPRELYRNRKSTYTLAKNDFRQKFAGSYLGIVWAFVQPVMTILVYWFVFSVGFKSSMVNNYPFVLFLTTGIIPWFFFSDALSGGATSLMDYSYLVKKVVFNIDILPLVRVISAFFVHLFFVAFGLLFLALYGYPPTVYTVQLIYYMVCCTVLLLGLSYFNSAIVVFFQDLKQIINIVVLQIGMWMTPILWDSNRILVSHPTILKLLKLNPVFYIVDGFRDCFLYHRWFFEKGVWTIYFWVVTIIIFVVGTGVFQRLKVHFADVM